MYNPHWLQVPDRIPFRLLMIGRSGSGKKTSPLS